jgi:hypothetical protein
VVATPSPVASALDFGCEVVDRWSPEVEREECASGWSGAGIGGSLMGGSSGFLPNVIPQF